MNKTYKQIGTLLHPDPLPILDPVKRRLLNVCSYRDWYVITKYSGDFVMKIDNFILIILSVSDYCRDFVMGKTGKRTSHIYSHNLLDGPVPSWFFSYIIFTFHIQCREMVICQYSCKQKQQKEYSQISLHTFLIMFEYSSRHVSVFLLL